MSFAIAFLLVMLALSMIMTFVTLVIVLNLHIFEIEEKDHWLNKLVFTRRR